MDLYLPTTPFIVVVVYFITYALRKYVIKTDEQRKSLPPIAAAIGCLIALVFYFFAPSEIEFTNLVDAVTSGMCSGLAAVGCNQVYKQFKRFASSSYNDGYYDPIAETGDKKKDATKAVAKVVTQSIEQAVEEETPNPTNMDDYIDNDTSNQC